MPQTRLKFLHLCTNLLSYILKFKISRIMVFPWPHSSICVLVVRNMSTVFCFTVRYARPSLHWVSATDPPRERHVPDVPSHAYTGMLCTTGSQKGQQNRNACSQKGHQRRQAGSQKRRRYGQVGSQRGQQNGHAAKRIKLCSVHTCLFRKI